MGGKMGHLLSGSFDGCFGSVYLLWSVFINTDCNKCGQTSRLATGAQIQPTCNCKKDIHSYTCLLDCFCCWRTSFYSYTRVCSLHRYSAVPSHHNRRLLKNFLPSAHNQIHRIHPLQGESQAIQMNTARFRKAVYSALWVQAALVVCYLPLIVAIALIHQRGMHLSSYLAWQFTSTLVYVKSSLNPFIYCWKIREVKLAVKETLRRLVHRWSG